MTETARKSAEWRYLLGTLTPDEAARVEEGFIADDGNFDEVELVEEELIDAYVRDELTNTERRQFETKLLTLPRIVDRVSFARVLAHRAVDSSQVESNDSPAMRAEPKVKWWHGLFSPQSPFQTALAASAIVLMTGGGILLFSWFQLRNEWDRIAAERVVLQRQKEENDKLLRDQQTRNEQTAADLQRQTDLVTDELKRREAVRDITNQSNKNSLPGTVASFMLSPGLARDPSQRQQLTLEDGVSTIHLNFVLEHNDHPDYQVTVRDASRRTVVAKSGLPARNARNGHLVRVALSAKSLQAGDYVGTVSGRLPNGSFVEAENYVFRVKK